MSHNNIALHQLLKPINRHEIESLAKKYHCGQKLRSVSRWDQFVGMILSQLSGRQSLRDIESNLRAQSTKLYHVGAKPIAKSSLARLNEKQPCELYEALFSKLLQKFSNSSRTHKFQFKNPLYSLDSSLIDLSLKIFPWADFNREKAAMKLHVGLNHSSMLPEFATLTEGKLGDMAVARTLNFPKGSIVAVDRGYNDFKWYKSLTEKGVFFVTRMRRRTTYRVVKPLMTESCDRVRSDSVIALEGAQAKKISIPHLRLIEFADETTGKKFKFLTNNFALDAKTIAAIYKDRWQIELFFKAIKQNLKIKNFVGTTKNAVMTQVWIALCAYLLVAYLKHAAKLDWSVQRLMRVLQLNLFERRSILDLVQPADPTEPIEKFQLRLLV